MKCTKPDCNREGVTDRRGLCNRCYMRDYRALKAGSNGQEKPVTSDVTANPAQDIGLAISAAITAAMTAQKGTSDETREYMDLMAQEIDSLRAELSEIKGPTKLEIKVGESVTVTNGLRHEVFQQVLAYVANKKKVFLVGPAGSGKTTLAEHIAEALGVACYASGAIYHKYELLGMQTATGEYLPSDFRKAYEHGGVFLFDEMDSSAPEALVAFNAMLANGHGDFPDGRIKKHEDFYAIAAGNTYGKGADRVYVGRTQLDGSTIDRFAFINMDYDENLENQLSANIEWTRKVQAWRRSAQDLKLRHIISPRASIDGGDMIQAGRPENEVAESFVWKGLEPAQVSKIKSHSGVN